MYSPPSMQRKKLDQEKLPVMSEHHWKVMSFYTEESKFGPFPQPEVTSLKLWVPLGETAPVKFSPIGRDVVAWERRSEEHSNLRKERYLKSW